MSSIPTLSLPGMALTGILPSSPSTVAFPAWSVAGQRSLHSAAFFHRGSSTFALAARSVAGQRSRHSAALRRGSSTVALASPRSVAGQRSRHTAARQNLAPSDKKLLEVIQSEIQCAVESNQQDVPVTPPEGFPFQIEDNPGECIITLEREYNGETITVEVNMPEDESCEEEGSEEDESNEDESDQNDAKEWSSDCNLPLNVRVENTVPLTVIVEKSNGAVLEFSCTAFPDEITIDALSMKNPEFAEDDIAYEGPDFSELDENLQKAFHKYLEVRGIKPIITNFLHEYMINKDNREYLKWLNQLKQFIKA